MIAELAPHQQRLAEMLGKRPGDFVAPGPQSQSYPAAREIRDGWLTELRHDPARALSGLQRTVQEHSKDAATEKMLAGLAMRFSENHDRAEPEPAFRACGAPGLRVNLAKAGQPVRVTLDTTGGGYLERLCEEHRQGLDSGKLRAVLAPGSDAGGCDWPVRQRPDDVPAFCDYCGSTTGLEEDDTLGTGDRPCRCHGMLTRPCLDTEACQKRREERYPPDLSRVPDWIFTAQQSITDEQSRQMILAACGAALGDFLELAAREDEETGLELAAPQPFYGVPAGAAGAWDTRGGYHPVNFNWSHWNWRHAISGGAHMGHAISGGARGAPVPLPPVPAQAAPDGAQDGGGQQAARREIPPVGVPEGVAQALRGDHAGGDIQMQQPELPEGAPQRPARPPSRRPQYGRRPGRKAAFGKRVLKYQGR